MKWWPAGRRPGTRAAAIWSASARRATPCWPTWWTCGTSYSAAVSRASKCDNRKRRVESGIVTDIDKRTLQKKRKKNSTQFILVLLNLQANFTQSSGSMPRVLAWVVLCFFNYLCKHWNQLNCWYYLNRREHFTFYGEVRHRNHVSARNNHQSRHGFLFERPPLTTAVAQNMAY